MKIRLDLLGNKISWSKEWTFVGKSYKNLNKIEKNIEGRRIKINEYLHKTFDEELKDYLEWTESQRVSFKDSEHWWMTNFSGKNNLSSDFLLFICQIKSIHKIINTNKYDEILIICDDIFVAGTLKDLFKKNNIITSYNYKIKFLNEFMLIYFSIFKNIIKSYLSIFYWIILSKIFLKLNKSPNGDVVLIHHFTDIKNLKENKILQSRIFPYLKEYLNNKNIKNYYLSWFYDFWGKRLKVLKVLKKESAFIIEQWISIKDLIKATTQIFNTVSIFNKCSDYKNLELSYLLKREKLVYLNDFLFNLKFWLYKPAIKNWSKNCKSLICIDHYENMVFEHALISAVRDLKIKEKKIYGYHHTLSSKEFTGWQSLETEWQSKFKPDLIISSGTISSNFLINQGIPKNKIIEGPALRYNNLLDNAEDLLNKDKNKILFPLSQIKDSSLELINKILILSKNLCDTNYELIIKPHPDIDIENILKSESGNNLPMNVKVSNESVDKLLSKCLFSVFMATGAAYNSVLNNCISFTLESELNLADNYLDIFKENHKYLNSHSLETLTKEFIELINDTNKLDNYKNEFMNLKKTIINGLNKVNDDRLKTFII